MLRGCKQIAVLDIARPSLAARARRRLSRISHPLILFMSFFPLHQFTCLFLVNSQSSLARPLLINQCCTNSQAMSKLFSVKNAPYAMSRRTSVFGLRFSWG